MINANLYSATEKMNVSEAAAKRTALGRLLGIASIGI
jgi:hypothetical protein